MDREALYVAASARAPVYYADAVLSWEERLAKAYDEASAALGSTLPPNAVANAGAFEAALVSSDSRIDADPSGLTSAISTGTDLPPGQEFSYNSEELRNFYWGKFSQASTGLGAYLSGAMREQVQLGSLSAQEFESGAAARLRAFSEIIHLKRTGTLVAAVNCENFARPDGSKAIRIASNEIVSVPTGAAGFGGGPLLYAIAIGVGAVLIAAGIACYFKYSADVTKSRMLALDVCKEAVAKGHPQAAAICQNMTEVANKTGIIEPPSVFGNLLGKDNVNTAIKWGLIGVGGLMVISFAPQIVSSLARAGEAYSEAQAKRLMRQRRSLGLGDE